MDRKRKMLILEFIFLLVICTLNKQMLIGFIWVILHEAVHILVANNFGLRLSSFKIHITGAGTEIDDIDDLSENRKLDGAISERFSYFSSTDERMDESCE